MGSLKGLALTIGFAMGSVALGCELPEDHGPQPYIQGQPPTTSKNTAYLYGSAEIGDQPQGPGYGTGGSTVDAGSTDAE